MKLCFYLLVVLISIPTFVSLMRPGYFPMHDDLQVMRIYQMELCFRDGQFPCRWVPDMGYRYGYPQFEYYGPLPYYLMTASRFVGLSLFSAMKLGFILPLLLGNLTMFLLGSSLFGPWGGLLSAAAYAYAPYRASDLYSRGAMGETWAFVFLPLILFALLRLFKKPNLKTAALLGLAYGGLLATHNISTLIFSPLIGLLTLGLLAREKEKKTVVKYGLIAAIWAVLVAGSFFLPLVFEKGYAHTESLIQGYFNYLAHFVTVKQLFFTTFWGYGSSEIGPTDDLSFFIGPVHLLLFLVAIILTLYRFFRRRLDQTTLVVLAAIIFTLLSLFMTHQKSTFLWQMLPLAYLQFPWRFLVTANFFLALSAGYLFYKLTFTKILPLAISLLILLFLTNVSFFRPRAWFDLTIWEKFSGYSWDRQLTISIFDYLPIYAKFPPALAAPLLPYGVKTKISILDFTHGSDNFRFTTKSLINDVLILPQFDFPGWQVKLDGKKVVHRHNNDLGLIALDLPAGEHRLEAALKKTPVRLFGDLTTLIFAPLALYTLISKNHNDKK
ncbi:MAG: hypothetical protein WAV56_05295 [Microgenomates group bacterium]